MRVHPALLLALVALAVAGCGSPKAKSLAQAKADLVTSCEEGKASDRPLCTCIAAKLASQHGYHRAPQYDAADKRVKSGKVPPEVTQSAQACAGRQ